VVLGGALPDGLDSEGNNLRPHHSPVFDFDEQCMLLGHDYFMELLRAINAV